MLQMSTLCCACFHHESLVAFQWEFHFSFNQWKIPLTITFGSRKWIAGWRHVLQPGLYFRAHREDAAWKQARVPEARLVFCVASGKIWLSSVIPGYSTSAFGLSTECFQGSELNLVYKMIHCYTADCRFNHHSPSALSLSLSSLLQLNVPFSHIF